MSTMTFSLSKFKKHPVLPVFAMITAVLLISGQIFNCCRLNESLSETLAQAFHRVGITHVKKVSSSTEVEPKSHPNCHGHGTENGTAPTTNLAQHIEPGQSQYSSEESCLSERTFTVNAQPSNPVSLIDLPVQVQVEYIDHFVKLPAQFERPRPQNKSSPPVYILTLRILV
jgi:hypothetical protein